MIILSREGGNPALACDAGDCRRHFWPRRASLGDLVETSATELAAQVRELAARKGWRHVAGVDVCPLPHHQELDQRRGAQLA